MPSFVDDATERFRDSRFGREVFGPRVARPLAGWLHANFAQDLPGDDHDDDGVMSGAGGVLEAEMSNAAPESGDRAETAVGLAEPESDPSETGEPIERGFVPAAKAVVAGVKHDNLVVVAAGIAFWGLLAIPATLFAVVSIAGLLLDPNTVRQQVNDNLSGLPEEAQEIIAAQLEGVSGGNTGGLIAGLVVGLVLALWTASGAMAKLMAALNTIYGVLETRNFAKLRGLALVLTFGGIVFVAGALFLLAVLPALLSTFESVSGAAEAVFVWLRFPVLAIVMIVALGVLYHVGPDRRGRYRLLSWGPVAATVLWLVLSGLFSVYTSTVGSYNETYGSIGGIVILLLWLFITAFVVLLGAEIHARSEQSATSDAQSQGSSGARSVGSTERSGWRR